MSQTELAAQTEIAFPQINRYTSGRSDLRPAILVKILRAFPEDAAAKLLCAYLIDQCPTEFRHLVDITAKTNAVEEPQPDALAYLPPDARDALYFLASKCSEPYVLDFILHMTQLLRAKKTSRNSDDVFNAVDQIAEESRTRRSQANRDSQAKKA